MVLSIAPKTCGPDEFTCTDEGCIHAGWVCDGADDCDDGADEKNCSKFLRTFPLQITRAK